MNKYHPGDLIQYQQGSGEWVFYLVIESNTHRYIMYYLECDSSPKGYSISTVEGETELLTDIFRGSL